MAGIEVFKTDMEDLGVPVSSVILTVPAATEHDVAMLLRTFIKEGLEEDLEVGPRGR